MMVSIIIPVFNSEKCIEKCIRSVINQTYSSIEILIIDDGSADNSFDIISSYQEIDKRINVIHQDNHGLVYSRKQGILRASGDYVLFVDSDDYIEPCMVEELLNIATANDADAVFSGAFFHAANSDHESSIESDNNGKDTAGLVRKVNNNADAGIYEGERLQNLKEKLFCCDDYCTMAVLPFLWNKLWKTSILREHVLSCDESIRVGEDVAIGFPAILSSEKIVITNDAYYHYFQYSDSMMRGNVKEEAEFNNAIRFYNYLLLKSKDVKSSEAVKKGIDRLFVNQLFTRCYGKCNLLNEGKGMMGFVETIPESVVIYGAGELGKSVFKYVNGKCTIKAWLDADFEYHRKLGYPVDSPNDYSFDNNDEIVVAVFSSKAVASIKKMLIERGCKEENIHCFFETRDVAEMVMKYRKVAMSESISREKVVIYGTGRRAAMYYKWILSFCDIQAFVTDDDSLEKTFTVEDIDTGETICADVIKGDELSSYDFDRIIVTAENFDLDRTLKEISAISDDYAKFCTSLDELVEMMRDTQYDYLKFVDDKQLEVIDEILNATDEQVLDYEWMLNRVHRYGVFCFPDDWMQGELNTNYFVYGLQQIPEEFAAFCNYIAGIEVGIAAEIGVYRGRSSFFICAVLARENRNLRYKMIDLFDRIDDFEKFKDKLPQLEKVIPSCSDDYKNVSFDFVFIDADHSYDASINDYNNVGQSAKVATAFHDIYAHEYDHENGGTVRTWKEVMERTADKEHAVFSKYPDKWMGIGVVKW
jgi:glycosyltransferase involved in cell wall biosynthesis